MAAYTYFPGNFSFPLACLIAISDNERGLISRSVSSELRTFITAFKRQFRRNCGPDESTRIQKNAHLIASFKKILSFLVGHRLPPVWVDLHNFASQPAKPRFVVGAIRGRNQVHDRHSSSADGYRLPVLAALIKSGRRFFASATLTFMAIRFGRNNEGRP